MRKPILWVLFCGTLFIVDMGCFVWRSLHRDWVWAAIDWACAMTMLLCTVVWAYRLHVAYRWRHRHEHQA